LSVQFYRRLYSERLVFRTYISALIACKQGLASHLTPAIDSIDDETWRAPVAKYFKIYPYLLRGMEIVRPNQVWAMDISYIPMASGVVYLAVVLDWATRRVFSWRLSITMEAAFCVETLEDALARHGRPEIFNTDQGAQFAGTAFTGLLASHDIAISMDGKGAWRDNVFVERL
jgi:transposase InsO family protein